MNEPTLLAFCFLLLLMGAVFSGLNIGLMMIRPSELKRKATQGDKVAERLYRYRKNGTYLIVCVLLGNVAVISTLSLLLEHLAGGLAAGIITTLTVTIFAEIVPQTIFVRRGYRFSRYFFWLLDIIFVLFWPLAKPLTILLDRLLGEELPTIFTREELTHLVDEHAKEHSQASGIDVDESRIVRGALDYSQTEAREVMTPLPEIITVELDDTIDVPLISQLKRSGHSRFPIISDGEYVGILFMKDLLGQELPQPLSHVYRDKIFDISADSPLDTVLSRFIQTKSHLFLVRDDQIQDGLDTSQDNDPVVGIITIEDVIEKILNREIADEFDPEN